jgi:predicted amidohydrolase YtcJ
MLRMVPLPVSGRILPAIALCLAAPARADVLIDNVNGMTLDANGKVERFTGLLVGDDGRIEQVLHRSDKRPGKVDYKLDAKGRVMIPGLIDSHIPLMKFGLSLLTGPDAPPDARPRPEDLDLAFAKAQQLLLAHGITAVADMGTTIEDWQTYRRAGDLGALRMRVAAYADGPDAMILIGGPGPTTWLYDDRLRLNGISLTLDGPLAARRAALKAPYADSPAKPPAERLSDTQLKNLMSRAAMDNFQVAVTANGDAAAATMLDAIDELVETYKGERRWRIEGAEVIDPADLARIGRDGMVASMQPLALARPLETEARLGPARLPTAYAWKALADAGATLAFGSGAVLSPPEPFAGMAIAITRQGSDGQPFGGWQPQQRLTREDALAAYTIGAARAIFADGRLGRIAQGQRADFLLLDTDPMLATPEELRTIRVLETWVNGKRVYQAGEQSKDATPPPSR